MTVRLLLLALMGVAAACADPEESPYHLAPCNGMRLPAPTNPIVCPDRVIRYDEAAAGVPGAPRCVPFMGTPCRCDNGAQGVDTCSTFGHPSGCFCDLPSAPGDIEGMGAPPPPLPPRLVAPLSGMRATSMRPTFRWVLPDGVTRARIELCDDRPCTRLRTRTEVTGRAWRPPQALRPGVVFWRVNGLGNTNAPVWTSATWEVGIPYRDTPVDSVNGPIRDVNGDGVDDIVHKSVYHSRLNYLAVSFTPGYHSAAQAARPTLYQTDREFGATNYDFALGDVNGDGMSDVLMVTSRGDALSRSINGPDLERSNPVAGVLFGDVGCPFTSRAAVPLLLPNADAFGIGSVGDFDGDGFGDVLAGMDEGAYLVRGSALGPSPVPTDFVAMQALRAAYGEAGIRFLGDVDGDGYSDLAVGNYIVNDGDGEVRILYGNPRARLDERVQVLRPHGGEFGKTLVAADFTGDGLADLVVGSYQGFDLFAGSSSGAQARQRVALPIALLPPTGVPFFLPMPGDFDGDGRPELAIFSGGLFYRPAGGSAGFFPLPVSSYSGISAQGVQVSPIGSPGDVNCDGYDDLLGLGSRRVGDTTMIYSLLHLGGSTAFCPPIRIWGTELILGVEAEIQAIHQ